MAGVGRPRLNYVWERKWWKENIRQLEIAGEEWPHLLWEGDGIGRYNCPPVTSRFGTRSVRRVLWAEAFGDLPSRDINLASGCAFPQCVSPRHSVELTASEAAAAAYNEDAPKKAAPWLKVGRKGRGWSDFTPGLGQLTALICLRSMRAMYKYAKPTSNKYVNVDGRDDFEGGIVMDAGKLPETLNIHLMKISLDQQKMLELEKAVNAVMHCEYARRVASVSAATFWHQVEKRTGRPWIVLEDATEDWSYPIEYMPDDSIGNWGVQSIEEPEE